jgi:hypothetical protein
MISVFQIFRVLMGVIIFIFVLAFFLRISDMYTSVQIMGSRLETVNTFDHTAMLVYTSGNPSTFPGFDGFETLVYEAPKIKHDAGQRTLSVPVFFAAGEGEVLLERRCLDFGWYRWCMVLAFPKATRILFTPLDNSQQARDLIEQVVENMPASLLFGYCSGKDARAAARDDFLAYLSGSAGVAYQECNVSLPEHYRLVTITSSAPSRSQKNSTGSRIFINPGAGEVYETGTANGSRTRPFDGWLDIAVLLTGGIKALDYKEAVFRLDLGAATEIMHQRSILVAQMTKEINRQPCIECSTPMPAACGWTDYSGQERESRAYKDFISSLSGLKGSVSGDYRGRLDDTVVKFDELKNQGCE